MTVVVPDELQAELIRTATEMAARRQVARLIYVCDLPLPEKHARPGVRKKVIQAVTSGELRDRLEEDGAVAVVVPAYEMGRQDKFKLALVAALARGYLKAGDNVVGIVGRKSRVFPDAILTGRVQIGSEEQPEVASVGEVGSQRIAPSVFDAIVELGVELGVEGWEGHALGTMFVIGDSAHVMEHSRQLALNPFQGYSESERNLANPAVRDALRNFATLEGAFVVREDGVVLAAGRFIEFEARSAVEVPLGLGARHMVAALVTASTQAIAVVVSQSTGKVRVFRGGRIVLELTPRHRRT